MEQRRKKGILRSSAPPVGQIWIGADNVESLCGAAAYDEKSIELLNSRNGFRDRSWKTRTGRVAQTIPKLRTGSCFPGFMETRRTAEPHVANAISCVDMVELKLAAAAFRSLKQIAPKFAEARLTDYWLPNSANYRLRANTFLKISHCLESPQYAEPLR